MNGKTWQGTERLMFDQVVQRWYFFELITIFFKKQSILSFGHHPQNAPMWHCPYIFKCYKEVMPWHKMVFVH